MKVILIFACLAFFIYSPDGISSQCFVDEEITEKFHTTVIEDVKKLESDKTLLSKGRDKGIPFGLLNSEWERVKQQKKKGDCLIFFTSKEKYWKSFKGREGYMLIRNGKVVDFLVTSIN